MKTLLRRLVIGLAAAAGAYAVLVGVLVWWVSHPTAHEFALPASTPLSEERAIEISRAALENEGLRGPQVRPETYAPEGTPDYGKYFAQNSLDPSNGYVLWRSDADSSWCYTTHLQRVGETVTVKVYRCK